MRPKPLWRPLVWVVACLSVALALILLALWLGQLFGEVPPYAF
jgi:hypothetical protein